MKAWLKWGLIIGIGCSILIKILPFVIAFFVYIPILGITLATLGMFLLRIGYYPLNLIGSIFGVSLVKEYLGFFDTEWSTTGIGGYIIQVIFFFLIGALISYLVSKFYWAFKHKKDDDEKVRKFWKVVIIVVMLFVLIGCMFVLIKLYTISIGCNYKKADKEMRVYDSQGRVTGVINGVQYRDIPDSFLFSEYEIYGKEIRPAEIILYNTSETYVWEIYALSSGNYVLTPSSTEEGEEISFTAENIPISTGETHRYNFDWDVLARGKEGATILIDENNDGIFEKNITSGAKISCQEFMLKSDENSHSKILWTKIIFIIIACIIIIIFIIMIVYVIKY